MIMTGLPSGPSAVSPNALANLRPSWNTWPSSMPRAICSGDPHRAHRSPSRISTAPISPSGCEVAAAHHIGSVLARRVRSGDPRAALDHERVDEVADLELGEPLRTDVALDQAGFLGEVVRAGLLDQHRFELAADALEVDVPVTRHADDQQLPSARFRACVS